MTLVLLLFAGGCAWWDLKKRRIPNGMILLGGLACLLIRFVVGIATGYSDGFNELPSGITAAVLMGFYEMGGVLLRAIIFICAMFPLYLFRMMGAGDIKMAAVLASGAGIEEGSRILLYGLITAGACSLFLMVRRGLVKDRIRYMRFYMYRFLALKTVEPYYIEARDGRKISFCMAPSLFIGLIAAQIIGLM